MGAVEEMVCVGCCRGCIVGDGCDFGVDFV